MNYRTLKIQTLVAPCALKTGEQRYTVLVSRKRDNCHGPSIPSPARLVQRKTFLCREVWTV
ncbi:unnamed protein product [Ixodes pacificus]